MKDESTNILHFNVPKAPPDCYGIPVAFPFTTLLIQQHASMDSGNHSHHYSARIALGLRLKHWRKLGELSIASAADALGVSTATWGHWETGEHMPSGDLLLAIEDLTHMPLHVLFCPHLDSCPHAKAAHPPPMDQPCCHCGASTAGKPAFP